MSAEPSLFTPGALNADYSALNILALGAQIGGDITGALSEGETRISRCSNGYGAIYIPSNCVLNSSHTVPSNVTLYLEYGAVLSVANGKTLTLNGGYRGAGSFGGAGSVVLNGITEIDWRDFGVKFDATNDYTSNFVAALTSAASVTSGGSSPSKGVVLKIPAGKFVLGSAPTIPALTNVTIRGTGGRVWSSGNPSASILQYGLTTGKFLDFGNGISGNLSLENIGFVGSSSSTDATNHGVYAASLTNIWVNGCNFNNFGGSGIRIDAGTNKGIYGTQATNCLLAAVPSSYSGLSGRQGVVEFGGTELHMNDCNINGVTGIADGNSGRFGNGFMIGVYIKGGVSICQFVVSAFAQYGWVIESSQSHQISDCRAEYNQGHGFVVECQQSGFVNCRAQDNSHDTDNTYDGFYVTGWSNSFTGNKIQHITFTNKHRYGINVNVGAGTGNTLAVNLSDNHMLGNGTRPLYNFPNANNTPFSVNGLNYRQALTGTGTQTFDGMAGDLMKLTVDANTTTLCSIANLIPWHAYTLVVLNSSGATPAITLDTMFDKITGYSAPASGKYRYITWMYDGSHIIGSSTGDI